MGNEIVRVEPATQAIVLAPLSTEAILTRVAQVKQIMEEVMKPDVHYGTIPGCEKPSLYQAGADKLAMAFRLAINFPRDMMTFTQTGDVVRCDAVCVVTDQVTGTFLGSESGTCSSDEEKYAWRKGYQDEFDAAPVEKRRAKNYKPKDRAPYTILQIRTNPADVANTVMAMACKRAKVRAVRTVLGVSDMFEVNIEDLPDELREEYFGDQSTPQQHAATAQQRQQAGRMEQKARAGASGTTTPPPAAPPAAESGDLATSGQVRSVMQLIEQIDGFTYLDGEGKRKWHEDAFRFLNAHGVKGKLKEQSGQAMAALIEALTEHIAALADAATPGDDFPVPDVSDPFADQ